MPDYLTQYRRTRHPGWIPGVRINPSVDNTLANLAVWLAADRLALNHLDAVGTWTDISGNGRDATQGTAANKPIFLLNTAPNGLPALAFDYFAKQYLQTASFNLGANNAVSIFAVCYLAIGKNDAARPVVDYNGLAAGGVAVRCNNTQYGAGFVYNNAANVEDNILLAKLGWQLLYGEKTAAGAETLRRGGTSKGTPGGSSFTVTASDVLTVGGYKNNSNNLTWGGMIAEVVVFNTSLSAANRTLWESYLMNKYSLPVG